MSLTIKKVIDFSTSFGLMEEVKIQMGIFLSVAFSEEL